MIMGVDEARHIRSSSELNVGDQIEAWHNGKLFHRGTVTQMVAAMDLFWILDSRTGTRRLIDAEALVILRAAAPGHAKAAVRAPPPPSRAPSASPHMPAVLRPPASRARSCARARDGGPNRGSAPWMVEWSNLMCSDAHSYSVEPVRLVSFC